MQGRGKTKWNPIGSFYLQFVILVVKQKTHKKKTPSKSLYVHRENDDQNCKKNNGLKSTENSLKTNCSRTWLDGFPMKDKRGYIGFSKLWEIHQ